MSNYLDAIKMRGEYGLKNFSKTVLSNLVKFLVLKNRLTEYGQICHVCVCRGLKIYQIKMKNSVY